MDCHHRLDFSAQSQIGSKYNQTLKLHPVLHIKQTNRISYWNLGLDYDPKSHANMQNRNETLDSRVFGSDNHGQPYSYIFLNSLVTYSWRFRGLRHWNCFKHKQSLIKPYHNLPFKTRACETETRVFVVLAHHDTRVGQEPDGAAKRHYELLQSFL